MKMTALKTSHLSASTTVSFNILSQSSVLVKNLLVITAYVNGVIVAMKVIQNLDRKRVCDISADHMLIEIRKKSCVTRITANPDGTLCVAQERSPPDQMDSQLSKTK